MTKYYDYTVYPNSDGVPGKDLSCGKFKSTQALLSACSQESKCKGVTLRRVGDKEIPWCMKYTDGVTKNVSDHVFFQKGSENL
jgi:hypothetical protein